MSSEKPTPSETTPAARFDLRRIAWQLIRGLRRWWLAALGWLVMTGLLALVVSALYTRRDWQAKATLLYTSLPMPEQQKELYAAPELKTLVALITSPGNLDAVCQKAGLSAPAKVLEKSLSVTAPPGTRLVHLTFTWQEGEQARTLLDQIIAQFMEQVAELRRRKLEGHIADYTRSLEASRQSWQEALGKLQDFNRREGLGDLKIAQRRCHEELLGLQGTLAYARRNRGNLQKQADQLEAHIRSLKADADKQQSENRQFEAAQETIADNRRRQDRLRELIADERKLNETRSLLDARRREAARIAPLVAKGLKKRSEYEALQAEIQVLVSRIEESEQIKQWKAELERIDKVVVPKGKQNSSGSPIIQQTLFRKLELQLQLTAADMELAQLEAAVEAKQKESERIARVQQEGESLLREAEVADAHRQRVEGQLAALRQLQQLGPTEFVVVTPATTGDYPASSNRKYLLLFSIGGGLALGLVLLLGLEMWHELYLPGAFARTLPLPILAEINPTVENLTNDLHVRSLALQIRQHAPVAGSLMLFSSSGPGKDVPALLDALASCLARRDERVLLLDARPGVVEASQGPGLGDYLSFMSDDLDEIIRPGATFGVDCLPAGQLPTADDSLGTHRMRELLDMLKERYSLLLVRGPALPYAVDLTILAGNAAGVVIVTDAVPANPAVARATVASLIRLGAPVIGQVVLNTD